MLLAFVVAAAASGSLAGWRDALVRGPARTRSAWRGSGGAKRSGFVWSLLALVRDKGAFAQLLLQLLGAVGHEVRAGAGVRHACGAVASSARSRSSAIAGRTSGRASRKSKREQSARDLLDALNWA